MERTISLWQLIMYIHTCYGVQCTPYPVQPRFDSGKLLVLSVFRIPLLDEAKDGASVTSLPGANLNDNEGGLSPLKP